jgi:Domain of unknown function (DU1801)
MAELKTKPGGDVTAFLTSVTDEIKKKDCLELLKLMKQVTKEEPVLWGGSMVGFGTYEYKGKSGRSGTWFITGFSPRKQNLTVYIMPGFSRYDELMKKLGKHTTGVSCLYMNNLDDVDIKVLKELVTLSYKYMKEKFK